MPWAEKMLDTTMGRTANICFRYAAGALVPTMSRLRWSRIQNALPFGFAHTKATGSHARLRLPRGGAQSIATQGFAYHGLCWQRKPTIRVWRTPATAAKTIQAPTPHPTPLPPPRSVGTCPASHRKLARAHRKRCPESTTTPLIAPRRASCPTLLEATRRRNPRRCPRAPPHHASVSVASSGLR